MTNDAKIYNVIFIRNPLKVKSENWQETAHKWQVIINGQEFDYYTGLGHREPITKWKRSESGFTYDELKNKNLAERGLKELLAISKPTQPKLDDVLHCLVMDSVNMSFAEWCSDFGYDTDSRKAFALYEACQQNTDKLRKAGINIEKERERLQDY